MSLYTSIRGALQTRAATAAGYPAENLRGYEGRVGFVPPEPEVGAKFVRIFFRPITGRSPFMDRVSTVPKVHRGLLQVSLYYASKGDPGTFAVEVLADAVKAMFEPNTVLTQDNERVTIQYAERADANDGEPDWIHCPVTIGWECISRSN